MITKIFFAAVAQPHSQRLRHLFAFSLAQRFIKLDGFFAFAPASPVVMRVPIAARHANPPARFLDEGLAGQRLVGMFLAGHSLQGPVHFYSSFRIVSEAKSDKH
jgi:hypothetical protein